MLLISFTLVGFWTIKFRIASDPLGVGTLTAFAVNFPSNSGITFTTAFPAPVLVITIFNAAARPLLSFLCILSTRFWSLVYAWIVSMCPFSIPNLSFTTLRIGVIAFVVHDAAEKMSNEFISYFKWLAPKTIFGISFPGAVRSTFDTPAAVKCLVNAFLSLYTPVLSISKALLISYFV